MKNIILTLLLLTFTFSPKLSFAQAQQPTKTQKKEVKPSKDKPQINTTKENKEEITAPPAPKTLAEQEHAYLFISEIPATETFSAKKTEINLIPEIIFQDSKATMDDTSYQSSQTGHRYRFRMTIPDQGLKLSLGFKFQLLRMYGKADDKFNDRSGHHNTFENNFGLTLVKPMHIFKRNDFRLGLQWENTDQKIFGNFHSTTYRFRQNQYRLSLRTKASGHILTMEWAPGVKQVSEDSDSNETLTQSTPSKIRLTVKTKPTIQQFYAEVQFLQNSELKGADDSNWQDSLNGLIEYRTTYQNFIPVGIGFKYEGNRFKDPAEEAADKLGLTTVFAEITSYLNNGLRVSGALETSVIGSNELTDDSWELEKSQHRIIANLNYLL